MPLRGSEFTIVLPMARESDLPSAARNNGASSTLCRPRRVLVVDDNVDAGEMLSLLVQSEGHDVVAAHDGAAALRLAASWKPDLVFLDIGMPGMDGYEIAQQLKQDRSVEEIELVALTGYGQANDIERSRRSGFDHHLVKPSNLDSLRPILGSRASFPIHSAGDDPAVTGNRLDDCSGSSVSAFFRKVPRWPRADFQSLRATSSSTRIVSSAEPTSPLTRPSASAKTSVVAKANGVR